MENALRTRFRVFPDLPVPLGAQVVLHFFCGLFDGDRDLSADAR